MRKNKYIPNLHCWFCKWGPPLLCYRDDLPYYKLIYHQNDFKALILKVPWHDNFTLWGFFNINMCSPSLPMDPQWLEMVIGVNRALGILLCLWENESWDGPIWNLAHYEVIRSKVTSPSSALPAHRIWPPMRERHHGFQTSKVAVGQGHTPTLYLCVAWPHKVNNATLSKFLCFLSRLAASPLALSTSIMRSSTSLWSLCLVFSREAHLEFTASICSSASWRRWASFFLFEKKQKICFQLKTVMLPEALVTGICNLDS